MNSEFNTVAGAFERIQDDLVDEFEEADGTGRFERQRFDQRQRGYSRPRVLQGGAVFEKAAVQFTRSSGARLPAAASAQRPALAGKPFAATAVSVIVHPWNPHVPTAHMNLRYFTVGRDEQTWYFGGGFDLTPYFPDVAMAVKWHTQALAACDNPATYKRLRSNCDEYFYLDHRQEPRGIGGLFFDDWTQGGFDACLPFVQHVAAGFQRGYFEALRDNRNKPVAAADEEWMLVRRGRYAEFNLIQDRGTKYGLQSGRRIESVLASLPPRAKWAYEYEAADDAPYKDFVDGYLRAKPWIAIVDNSVDKSAN